MLLVVYGCSFLVWGEKNLAAYINVTYANCKTARPSLSGSVVMYAERTVSWLSQTQHFIGLSSYEAEHVFPRTALGKSCSYGRCSDNFVLCYQPTGEEGDCAREQRRRESFGQ